MKWGMRNVKGALMQEEREEEGSKTLRMLK